MIFASAERVTDLFDKSVALEYRLQALEELLASQEERIKKLEENLWKITQ